MIRTPTVLVVGAGGSAHLKFPIGFGLVKLVLSHTVGDTLVRFGFTREESTEFATALRMSGSKSVDAFLEHRPAFLPIGKLAIAHALIPFENRDVLFAADDGRPNWYDHLFEKMNVRREDLAQNRLAVLTFNYDRSLDYYLRTAVQNRYGCSPDEAVQLLMATPVIHLHGALGSLEERPYSYETDLQAVRTAAAGIRVIHEGVDGEPQFARAQKVLATARRIYFVGFGYDQTNLDRIGLGQIPADAEIYGSAFDLTSREKEAMARPFGRHGKSIQFGASHSQALQFLRKSVALNA